MKPAFLKSKLSSTILICSDYNHNITEEISNGDFIIASSSEFEVSNVVLTLIHQYAEQQYLHSNAIIVHISLCSNIFWSLSHVEPFGSEKVSAFVETERLRSFSVHNALQLLALLEYFSQELSPHAEAIIIFEKLNPIFGVHEFDEVSVYSCCVGVSVRMCGCGVCSKFV